MKYMIISTFLFFMNINISFLEFGDILARKKLKKFIFEKLTALNKQNSLYKICNMLK